VNIPNTWSVGDDRCTHQGFAVFTLGKLNKPMDLVGAVGESAQKAVERAGELGDGYAAFRVFKSARLSCQPKEMIQRRDLPVYVGP
jgi:hypothetical protein